VQLEYKLVRGKTSLLYVLNFDAGTKLAGAALLSAVL
jgi:hypothetical protein